MFIPLHDGKPVRYISLQWVTLTIIAINVLVFVALMPFAPPDGSAGSLVVGLGHVPSVSNDLRSLPVAFQVLPDNLYFLTGITYAFVHSDWWHLAGNMLFLWVFGDNVEDALGHFRYLVFYLAAAFVAAWFHAFMFPDSDAPLIGASGSAAAIVAAYLMLHPKMKIWVLVFARIPLRLPALWILGAWIAFQVVMFFADDDEQISWAAHLGGIVAGLVMVAPLKRRDIALFDRDLVRMETPVPEIPREELDKIKPVRAGGSQRWGRGGRSHDND